MMPTGNGGANVLVLAADAEIAQELRTALFIPCNGGHLNGRPDIAHRDLNSGVPAPAADPHLRPAERDSFEMLCRDTGVSFDECIEKAQTSWYVKANEALKLRLVEGGL